MYEDSEPEAANDDDDDEDEEEDAEAEREEGDEAAKGVCFSLLLCSLSIAIVFIMKTQLRAASTQVKLRRHKLTFHRSTTNQEAQDYRIHHQERRRRGRSRS